VVEVYRVTIQPYKLTCFLRTLGYTLKCYFQLVGIINLSRIRSKPVCPSHGGVTGTHHRCMLKKFASSCAWFTTAACTNKGWSLVIKWSTLKMSPMPQFKSHPKPHLALQCVFIVVVFIHFSFLFQTYINYPRLKRLLTS
jgi:hypothetical protein